MNLKSIVESANVQWNKALNSGSLKMLSKLYTENATISAGDGTIISGRSEIEKLFAELVKNGVHNHTLEIIEVGGSDKIIYQVSKWHANGADSSSFGGISMSVLEQNSDAKWHTNSHIWNVKLSEVEESKIAQIPQNAPYPVEVESGKSYYWCSCGQSKSQPLCDGSHKGTEFSPVKFDALVNATVYFCGCKKTANPPLCDGTHTKL